MWLLAAAAHCASEEWPQWRGPTRNGQSNGVKPPSNWPKELDIRWQVEVGLGHASPIVSDRKVYVFARRGDDEVLACLNLADGKTLWQQKYAGALPGQPRGHDARQGSQVDAGRGRRPRVHIRHQRYPELLRCKDRQVALASRILQAIRSHQPAVRRGDVAGRRRRQVHRARRRARQGRRYWPLDVKTGDTIWSWADDGPAYASPIIVTIDDVRQVVTQSQKACVGIDVDEGKLLWKIPFQTEYDQNAVTPIEHEGSLVFSGVNKGIDRYRVQKQDDEWETDNIWENKEVSLYMSSPVTDGETLYGFSHRHKGELFAMDLTTGKTLWTSDGRLGDNASLVETGNVIWALTSQAELLAFRASDKQFDLLAHYKVAETPTWAHPVILAGGVLVKDETKLTLWTIGKRP